MAFLKLQFFGSFTTFLTFAIVSASFPTAVFHGMGDQCSNSGMVQITRLIENETGEYAECIEIGNGAGTSLFRNFEAQASEACETIRNNSNFNGSFNAVGLSQGALIARYIAETCFEEDRVRNLLSIGGPNMGVQSIPHCFSGSLCNGINWIVRKFVYSSFIQHLVGPAGYFRHPQDYELYLKNSIFLPHLNHEADPPSFALKNTLRSVQNIMLVMFSNDTMMFPKETAWFQQLDENGFLLPLNATKFYQSDFIGLRNMDEAGKVKFVEIHGDHLQFTLSDFNDIFIPFLSQ